MMMANVEVTLRNEAQSMRTIYDPWHRPLAFKPGDVMTVTVTQAMADALALRTDLVIIGSAILPTVPLGPPLAAGSKRRIVITIPAFGRHYVDQAVRYAIPAALAALQHARASATFLIVTDDPKAFEGSTDGHAADFSYPKLGARGLVRDPKWGAFVSAHIDGMVRCPDGDIAALLNAETVVSVETFVEAERIFATGRKVIATIGFRANTPVPGDGPPIGADAEALMQWAWAHRHYSVGDQMWGTARPADPTCLYFPHPNGAITCHDFHINPMLMVGESRRRRDFTNTIDDDCLGAYAESEIHYLEDRRFAVTELTDPAKPIGVGKPATVASVVGARQHRLCHVRSFGHGLKILGEAQNIHPAALDIYKALAPRHKLPFPPPRQKD